MGGGGRVTRVDWGASMASLTPEPRYLLTVILASPTVNVWPYFTLITSISGSPCYGSTNQLAVIQGDDIPDAALDPLGQVQVCDRDSVGDDRIAVGVQVVLDYDYAREPQSGARWQRPGPCA